MTVLMELIKLGKTGGMAYFGEKWWIPKSKEHYRYLIDILYGNVQRDARHGNLAPKGRVLFYRIHLLTWSSKCSWNHREGCQVRRGELILGRRLSERIEKKTDTESKDPSILILWPWVNHLIRCRNLLYIISLIQTAEISHRFSSPLPSNTRLISMSS